MSFVPIMRSSVGLIADEFWPGGGEYGDGRDMTGAAPRPERSFLAARTGRGGDDLREQAVEFETPESLLLAKEEVEARLRRAPKNGVAKSAVHVDGVPLEDWIAGKTDSPDAVLPLALLARTVRKVARVNRRRGGRERQ